MIVSNGTSKFTTTFTGVSPCKAAACGCVLGKPSKSQDWSPSFFSSEETRLTITSSGTSSPLSMKALASLPMGVPSLILCRRRSPELTCFSPKSRTIQLEMVPFPLPGAPKADEVDSHTLIQLEYDKLNLPTMRAQTLFCVDIHLAWITKALDPCVETRDVRNTDRNIFDASNSRKKRIVYFSCGWTLLYFLDKWQAVYECYQIMESFYFKKTLYFKQSTLILSTWPNSGVATLKGNDSKPKHAAPEIR